MKLPIRVGLIGAGPWAEHVHAPGLAAHDNTILTTIWARRPEVAGRLADAHGAAVSSSVEKLLDQVDAVAFAVPPNVQSGLAIQAAEAGKHLILEKPLAANAAEARKVVDAVTKTKVTALMMLTMRYAAATKAWLHDLAATGVWSGGNAKWLSGALLSDFYGNSAWRHEFGALADVGPHALDLLDAAIGPIDKVLAASTTTNDLWQILLEHDNGAISTATLSVHTPVDPSIVELTVYGDHGYRSWEREPGTAAESYAALLDDFTGMIASGETTHPCDASRGLYLQVLLDRVRALTTTD